jgi:pterin-4a-carbinolamine dehydratase
MATSKVPGAGLGNLIFLSYRRADSAPQTLALRLEFETRFRAVQVFVDTHTVQGGDMWEREIKSALHLAKVFVPVIGKAWAGTDSTGKRRIDDRRDWVRREVGYALANKPDAIMPICVDCDEPDAKELPAPIRALAKFEYMQLNLDTWERDVRWIIDELSGKFGLELKSRRYRFPKPDPKKATTIPVPPKQMEAIIATSLPEWRIEFSDDPGKRHYKWAELTRDFEFKSFRQAVTFMDLVAIHAEKKDHHPRLVNLHATISVYLSTWDAGHRVTKFDVAFAEHLERIYKQFRRDQ